MENIDPKIISILALVVASLSLYISYRNYRKSLIKLKIFSDESYSLGFTFYEPYEALIVQTKIINKSASSFSIQSASIIFKTVEYEATYLDVYDAFNKNGITLLLRNTNKGRYLNIKTENILSKQRIDPYGVINGYFTFRGFPLITKDETVTLKVKTPTKTFKKNIIVSPLPDRYNLALPPYKTKQES